MFRDWKYMTKPQITKAVGQLANLTSNSVGVCDELSGAALVDNLHFVQRCIHNATRKAEQTSYWRGQKPSLLAVSKTISPAFIKCCYNAGQMKFGENYIQELFNKSNALKSECPNIEWHFIGTVQSNKIAKLAEIDNLTCVETICSKKHSSMLAQAIAKHNRTLKVLVQVNTSKEKQKGGTTPELAVELAKFIQAHCPSLKFGGFMTIVMVHTRFCEITGEKEEDFELSMGMSQDFEAAIMLGSTSVRVGSAIFGPRLLQGKQ
uniref:Pyridoxal phosphate homeostasis protein n=1 Tax=Setaria digitata TaxID=48799 RepID=A0A915Q3Y0_9BILA